jgi:hypothetical protein
MCVELSANAAPLDLIRAREPDSIDALNAAWLL